MTKTHGCTMVGTPGFRIYRIYKKMKSRCYNKNSDEYRDYGGRGIEVCNTWKLSFESFRHWALMNGYQSNLSIDRIDNNGNYSPENCRWATATTQNQNKRNNKLTSELVKEIRQLRADGVSGPTLAKKYNCTAGYIYTICSNKTWISK